MDKLEIHQCKFRYICPKDSSCQNHSAKHIKETKSVFILSTLSDDISEEVNKYFFSEEDNCPECVTGTMLFTGKVSLTSNHINGDHFMFDEFEQFDDAVYQESILKMVKQYKDYAADHISESNAVPIEFECEFDEEQYGKIRFFLPQSGCWYLAANLGLLDLINESEFLA